MLSTVIRVENLSKRYFLSHRQQERFPTFRDALTKTARSLGHKLSHPLRASGGQPDPEVSGTEEFWALKDVSFEVKRGDRVGIIGWNGAGKSTLLKIVSRITEPTIGRVSVKGRVASLLEVGTGFHPELTGRENIYLNGAVLGMGRAEIRRKFDEIVSFAEVEKFLDTPVKRYSSGMYVRLAFSVAAHLEPEILIIDEVLAVGDAQFQAKCLQKMKRVALDGNTVLFVSHNLGVVENFCNRGVLLKSGKVLAQGTASDIVKNYLEICQEQSNNNLDLVEFYSSMSKKTLVFEKISIMQDKKTVKSIEMGKGLQIVLKYRLKKPTKFLKFGIHLLNSVGNLVCILSPNQQISEFEGVMKDDGTIYCNIPFLNLLPDTYILNVSCDIPGTQESYQLQNVASFQVLEKDVYFTGVIPSKIHGLVYFPAEWSFS